MTNVKITIDLTLTPDRRSITKVSCENDGYIYDLCIAENQVERDAQGKIVSILLPLDEG